MSLAGKFLPVLVDALFHDAASHEKPGLALAARSRARCLASRWLVPRQSIVMIAIGAAGMARRVTLNGLSGRNGRRLLVGVVKGGF